MANLLTTGNLRISIGFVGSKRESSRTKSGEAKTFTALPALVYCCLRSIGGIYEQPDKFMKANKVIAGTVVALVLLASSPFILGLIWPRINDVRTGATPEYPDIQPQRFDQPFDKVLDAALAVAQAMGWEIRETNREQGIIEAVATTRLFKFKDDVTITISREGPGEGGGAVVNVRSKSRVGKGDLGTNARRIRAFQAELAKRL